MFESGGALRGSLALFDRPKLSTCLERALRRSLRTGHSTATVVAFALDRIPVTIPGVEARGFRITINATDKGQTGTIVSDEILAWTGRLGSSATITTGNGPPPDALESEVATVVGRRLLAAA